MASLPPWTRQGPTQYQREERARINRTISQDHPQFKEVYELFKGLLFGDADTLKPIEIILSEHFTQHEAQLLTPSSRPDLKQQQERNTAEYLNLLVTRFNHFERHDLALKLAMLYFGLAVEPMISPFEQFVNNMEIRKPEPAMYDVEPPLHFLTAHKERNWGREELKGREDVAYPLRVDANLFKPQFEELREKKRGGDDVHLSLRGGGDEDKSDEDEAGTDSDEEAQFSSLGAPIAFGGSSSTKIFGFQGWVYFEPDNWKSFTTAVAKLLSLRPSERGEYTLVIFKKDSRQESDEIRGDLPTTHKSTEFLYLRNLCRAAKEELVFFVKLPNERTPQHWKPEGNGAEADERALESKVAKVLSEDGQACCYIAFPSSPHIPKITDWGVNQFTPYLRSAFEVLTGRIAGGFHDAFFALTKESDQEFSGPYSYGMHSFHPFDIQSLFSAKDGEHHILKRRPSGHDSIVLYFPAYGYEANLKRDINSCKEFGSWLVLHPTESKTDSTSPPKFLKPTSLIREHVREIMGEDYRGVSKLLLVNAEYLCGDDARPKQCLIPREAPVFIGDAEDRDVGDFFDSLSQDGKKYLIIHPTYSSEADNMIAGWLDAKANQRLGRMPPLRYPKRYSRAWDFRLALNPLLEAKYSSKRLESSIISIKPLAELSNSSTRPENAPTFSLTYLSDFRDWVGIRSMINTPYFLVDIESPAVQHWKLQISKENPWGPRYGTMSWKALPKVRARSRRSRGKSVRFDIQSDNATQIEEDRDIMEEQDGSPAQWEMSEAPPDWGDSPAIVGVASRQTAWPQENMTEAPPDWGDIPVVVGADSRPKTKLDQDMSEAPPEWGDSPVVVGTDSRPKTWLEQPSVFDTFRHSDSLSNFGAIPRFPITAPPIEAVLRTSSSVPIVTKAVLTPSEQARLQKAVWDMRNMLLGRAIECQYENCDFYCRRDQKHVLHEHIRDTHQSHTCLWCDDLRYKSWTKEQRKQHLREEHSDELVRVLKGHNTPVTRREGKRIVALPLTHTERGKTAPRSAENYPSASIQLSCPTQTKKIRPNSQRIISPTKDQPPRFTHGQDTSSEVSSDKELETELGTELISELGSELVTELETELQRELADVSGATSKSESPADYSSEDTAEEGDIQSPADTTEGVEGRSTKRSRRRRRVRTADGAWVYESDSEGEIERDEQAMAEAEAEEAENNKKKGRLQDGSYRPGDDTPTSSGEEDPAPVTPKTKQSKKKSPGGRDSDATPTPKKSQSSTTQPATPGTGKLKTGSTPSKTKTNSSTKKPKSATTPAATGTDETAKTTPTKKRTKVTPAKRKRDSPAKKNQVASGKPGAVDTDISPATPAMIAPSTTPTAPQLDSVTKKHKTPATTAKALESVAKKRKAPASVNQETEPKPASTPAKKPKTSKLPSKEVAVPVTPQRVTRSQTKRQR